jgi:GT2 family glycosyltransferase
MNNQPTVALVVTSCGRRDLLNQTLQSFKRHNTYQIAELVLIEDGMLDHEATDFSLLLGLSSEQVTIIKNEVNIGQIKSIDRAYAIVKSEFIFHCEDDWEFFTPGFIEESMDILSSDPKLICVWLRAHNDTMGHPIEKEKYQTPSGSTYRLIETHFRGIWHGFTFNPGLRRTKDCLTLTPYASMPILHQFRGKTSVTESDISIHYFLKGYRAAISERAGGFVRHIGAAEHITNEWESHFTVQIKNRIKRLIFFLRNTFKSF